MKSSSLRTSIDAFYAFLGTPLYLWARPLLLLLTVPLVMAVIQPLWHVRMEAPQYPNGLSVDIFSHTIESGNDGKDLAEINILNHYIGMRKIERAAFADLDWMPFAFGALAILLLRVAAVGDVRALIDLAVVTLYISLFSGSRFLYKMWVYGHDLSPEAPVKIPPFMPAVLGTKQVGNFTTHAEPGLGTYLLGAFVVGVVLITLVHLFMGRKRAVARARLHAANAVASVG